MIIPKRAIELAIEGGWKSQCEFVGIDRVFIKMRFKSDVAPQPIVSWMWERVALDPTFWVALGKALGWATKNTWTKPKLQQVLSVNEWPIAAHRFYDLVLTNQSTEQFWKDMLK